MSKYFAWLALALLLKKLSAIMTHRNKRIWDTMGDQLKRDLGGKDWTVEEEKDFASGRRSWNWMIFAAGKIGIHRELITNPASGLAGKSQVGDGLARALRLWPKWQGEEPGILADAATATKRRDGGWCDTYAKWFKSSHVRTIMVLHQQIGKKEVKIKIEEVWRKWDSSLRSKPSPEMTVHPDRVSRPHSVNVSVTMTPRNDSQLQATSILSNQIK
jgi:hypothetical protein